MKKLTLVLLFAIICGALIMTGCATSASSADLQHDNKGTFGEHVRTPSKDFETRGLVFSETTYQVNRRGSSGSVNGEVFTYQELLKEAQRLGADAIINVVIDRRVETSSSSTSGNNSSTRIETWYGSALAIRYTNTLKDEKTSATTPTYYMNDGASQSAGGGGQAQDVESRAGGIRGLLGL